MPERSMPLGAITFDGATDQTNLLPPLDYSGFQSLRGELVVSAVADDDTDLLAVRVESLAQDGATWNTRMAFPLIAGDASLSSGPEVRIMNVQNRVVIDSTEESYESTGSDGAAAVSPGSVRNGPFPPRYRTTAGLQPNWRVVWDVTDGSGDADFTATLNLMFGH